MREPVLADPYEQGRMQAVNKAMKHVGNIVRCNFTSGYVVITLDCSFCFISQPTVNGGGISIMKQARPPHAISVRLSRNHS